MPDNHYINSRLAEIYDLDSGWSADRDFYLSLAGAERQTILDLGCGTGLLCNAYAALNHDVTGVDPSDAMLEVARRKPFGDQIDWVESTAQAFCSDKLFDLIVMTGHAFQVLLTDADILETFSTVCKHLKSGGTFVFESRNPLIDWQKEWDYDIALSHSSGAVRESRRFVMMNDDKMKFELRYQFFDETLISTSELRFTSHESIGDFLTASALCVEKIMGDWNGEPFDVSSSYEMIFLVH